MIQCYLRRLMADNKIDDIADLMRMSGLSRNAINRLYKGSDSDIEVTNLRTLIELCKVFKCNLSELLEYIPEDNE